MTPKLKHDLSDLMVHEVVASPLPSFNFRTSFTSAGCWRKLAARFCLDLPSTCSAVEEVPKRIHADDALALDHAAFAQGHAFDQSAIHQVVK